MLFGIYPLCAQDISTDEIEDMLYSKNFLIFFILLLIIFYFFDKLNLLIIGH